ncbi:unnamed protein product [Mesocestoides corti]|uniref:Uncharacterized protein n=1 Tax=Mesocestoides corti TaxID=53468 RepID=A0A3P6ICF1_MESCO|nr:unnamed protein product [Mesocestoides corti]
MWRTCVSTISPPSQILDERRLTRLLSQPAEAANFAQLLRESPDFDATIVRPLLDVAKLTRASILDLLQIALSPDLPTFYSQSFSPQTRRRLLQPDFVLSQLKLPLMRFGVTNPERVIRRCPSLFTAAVMQDGGQTRLLASLSALKGFLTKKDLGTLVKNYPSECVMGLESSAEVKTVAKHSHETRHSTRLCIAASPAWCLPLKQTIARHTLLLLANQFLDKTLDFTGSSCSLSESRDYIAGKLLTCPPERFSYWLEYHDEPEAAHVDGRSFSGADVRQFEKICACLESEEPSDGAYNYADDVEDDEDEIYESDSDDSDQDPNK